MEKLIYEYCIIRFVPDIERGEFINIGLLMMCKRRKWLRCAMNIDEKKITALCAACDIERLKKVSKVLNNACVVYSMWEGYKEENQYKKFLDKMKELDIDVISLHVSRTCRLHCN